MHINILAAQDVCLLAKVHGKIAGSSVALDSHQNGLHFGATHPELSGAETLVTFAKHDLRSQS